jgi:hypothetical protein
VVPFYRIPHPITGIPLVRTRNIRSAVEYTRVLPQVVCHIV